MNKDKLSNQEVSFFKEKSISINHNKKNTLKFLSGIAQADALIDKKRAKLKKLRLAFFLVIPLILILGIIFFPVALSSSFETPLGLGFYFVIAIILIVLFIKINQLNKVDIDNNIRLFVIPYLRALSLDISQKTKIAIDLNGQPIKQTTPIESTFDVPRGNCKQSIYSTTWFKGNTKLIDETKIKWEISDKLVVKRLSRRGISGKTKIKSKQKLKRRINLSISFRKAYYQPDKKPSGFKFSENEHYFQYKTNISTVDTSPDTIQSVMPIHKFYGQAYAAITAINTKHSS